MDVVQIPQAQEDEFVRPHMDQEPQALVQKKHPLSRQQRSNDSEPTKAKVRRTIFLAATLVLGLLGLLLLCRSGVEYTKLTGFKHILWIYTEALFQAEEMNQIIYLHHLNHTFEQMGYHVCFVNSWNAYDYLPDPNITSRIGHTMQNSQLDEGVHNLLKLALLQAHGGVMFTGFDTVLASDDLSWIPKLFSKDQQNSITNNEKFTAKDSAKQKSKKEDQLELSLPPAAAEVFLYEFKEAKLSDIFIAARPHSRLIRQAFDTLEELIRTGSHSLANQTQLLKWNEDRGVGYLAGGLESILNLVVLAQSKSVFSSLAAAKTRLGIQSLKKKNYLNLAEQSQKVQTQLLLKPDYEESLRSVNLQGPTHFLFKVNVSTITDFIASKVMHLNIQDPQPLPEYSLIWKVLSAPHNKQVFFDPLPERQLELCLILMENLNRQQIQNATNAFNNQTYGNWTLVLPSLEPVAAQPANPKVKIVNGNTNKLRNIEKACTRHCNPKGYAVLLNFGENFNSVEALSEIAKAVSPRDSVAAFITLEHESKNLTVTNFPGFNRNGDAIVEPNIEKMEIVINHLRLFSIETFRYIPQMDLRDIFGNYFEDRLVFLMTLLEVVRAGINLPFHFYLAKKYIHIMDIPASFKYVSPAVHLRVTRLQTANREQINRLKPRLVCEDIRQSMIQTTQSKIPFSKMFAFNPGNDFVSVDDRQGPQLIPRIIHQVWLGSKLPPAKDYFYRKTQRMYPGYQVKLWREENITREKFPLNYDVIQTLIKFNKRSPYNKLASVTDILRHEVLYHEGGFWKDAGMNLLRPIFGKFLKYKLALGVDKTFRYRWEQGMCFFANMPRYDNLWRITNFRNINRMRIYDNYAMIVAGPIDFSQLLVGQEEYDPDIILLPYETFYPAQLIQHPLGDLCTKRFEELGQAEYQVQEKGWYLLSNCSQIYPYAYAVEHNRFGGTWNKRQNLNKFGGSWNTKQNLPK